MVAAARSTCPRPTGVPQSGAAQVLLEQRDGDVPDRALLATPAREDPHVAGPGAGHGVVDRRHEREGLPRRIHVRDRGRDGLAELAGLAGLEHGSPMCAAVWRLIQPRTDTRRPTGNRPRSPPPGRPGPRTPVRPHTALRPARAIPDGPQNERIGASYLTLRLVGHVGLEPTTNGLKVRCSAN